MTPTPDQPNHTNKPILGFVAGTPIVTPEGHKPVEQVRPGDFIQTRPDDDPADHEPQDVHDEDRDGPDPDLRRRERN